MPLYFPQHYPIAMQGAWALSMKTSIKAHSLHRSGGLLETLRTPSSGLLVCISCHMSCHPCSDLDAPKMICLMCLITQPTLLIPQPLLLPSLRLAYPFLLFSFLLYIKIELRYVIVQEANQDHLKPTNTPPSQVCSALPKLPMSALYPFWYTVIICV